VQPAIAAGLAAAGRPADACPISASPLVAIAADADRARRAARLQLAFYATTPNYRGVLALHDREAVVAEVRRAFVRGDRQRMIAAIDDELLDAIAIAGRPDEARGKLAAWDGIADRAILGPPWYGIDADFERELWDGIVEVFGTSRGV
jgi:alkanesulfonate monooxygenase SsuD/methylene tetrahydromethanopterin reductase-like flavin-dependent oxidoreductase (luciferase family)